MAVRLACNDSRTACVVSDCRTARSRIIQPRLPTATSSAHATATATVKAALFRRANFRNR
jgi:hypothetical protein